MIRILLALCALFIPQLVAADLPSDSTGLFTPVPGDLSVQYLADIFGVVDGVLHGTGSQIMGAMFGVFNAGVLTLGAIVMMYTLIVSTLNTAQDGEVMGQKWSSIWVPLRSAMGFAFMLPKASGYSFIQIFVMWVVVQGIGVGDAVWNTALNYLQRGGVLIQPSPSPGSLGVPALINPIAGNIFKSQTCMFGMYNGLMNVAASQQATANTSATVGSSPVAVSAPPVTYNSFATTLVVEGAGNKQNILSTFRNPAVACAPPLNAICDSNGDGGCQPGPSGSPSDCGKCDCMLVMEFPGPGTYGFVNGQPTGNDLHGMCGNVMWASSGDGGVSNEGSSTQIANSNAAPAAASDSRSIATQQMVLDVQPVAQSVANLIVPPSFAQPSTTPVSTYLNNRLDIGQAATDYAGMMQPFLTNQQSSLLAQMRQSVANLGGQGWILAGSYYYNLSFFSGNGSGTGDSNPPIATYNVNFSQCGQGSNPPCVPQLSKTYTNALALELVQTPSNGTGTIGCSGPQANNGIDTDNFICYNYQNPPAGSAGNGSGALAAGTPAMATGGVGLGIGALLATINPILGGFIMAASAGLLGMGALVAQLSNNAIDPIIAISNLGVFIVNWVEAMWVAGVITTFFVTLFASIGSCVNPGGYAILGTLIWFVPMITAMFVALIATGAMMAYYVPLIPFIVFLFTAIGWFAAVLEAMIAAPLVALGITHPEGPHEIMGKSEPAVMLLTNIFMRPTLIIFGFLAGCILSHIALWLLNQGFANVMPSLHQFDILGDLITTIATLIVYVSIVMAIINRCFTLTYEVPNKILRWLSGGEQAQFGGGEEAAIGQVHGSVQGGMQAIQGGMEKGASSAGSTGELTAKSVANEPAGGGGAASLGGARKGSGKKAEDKKDEKKKDEGSSGVDTT